MSQFFGGALDPTWPHAVLIAGSIIGGALVGLGVILEAPKILSIPVAAVFIGIVIEAACTLLLFGFDEGISGAQQSTIEGQRSEIISLQKSNVFLISQGQELEALAIRARREASQAIARAAQLEKDAAVARASVAEANAAAAKANENAAKANERAAELQLALEDRKNRSIKPEQKAAIIERLRPLPEKGKIIIRPLITEGEAYRFSDQIAEVLRAAGYQVEDAPLKDRLMALNRTGSFLWFKDASAPPERVKNIATAFRLVGITIWGEPQPDLSDPDEVDLVVSTHP
jgi:hypothetical protein